MAFNVNDNGAIYDNVPDSTAIDNISFFCWIKIDTLSDDHRFFMNGHTGSFGQGYHFLVTTGNYLAIDVSFKAQLTSTLQISDNDWHFVGFTRNSGTWTIYLDSSSESVGTTTPYGMDSSSKTVVGGINYNGSVTYSMQGSIARVGYWASVLSSTNISDLYDGDAVSTIGSPILDFPMQVRDSYHVNDGSGGNFFTSGTMTFDDDPFESFATWTGSREITIDNTKVSGSSNFTNFPFVFSGTYDFLKSTANGGEVTHASGYDIWLTDSSGNKLDFYVERWDGSTGEVTIHAKVPTLSYNTDTTLYVKSGNSTVIQDQSYATNVWDSNFKAFWSMANLTNPKDITASPANLTSNGGLASGDVIGGTYGDAIDFERSSSQYLNSATSVTKLNITGDITIEAWVKFDNFSDTHVVYMKGDGATYVQWQMQVKNTGILWLKTSAGGNWNTGLTLSTGTWYYLVCKVDVSSGDGKAYANASSATTSSTFSAPSSATTEVFIGYNDYAPIQQYMDGVLDGVRISDTLRSDDWITTVYNNTMDTANFYSLPSGADEVTPSPVSLTLTAVAPTVTAYEEVTVTPSPVSLTLTPITPTVSYTQVETTTPDPVTLTLTPIAPTATGQEVATVTPDPLSLTITLVTPTIATQEVVSTTPDPVALTLTTIAPTITVQEVVTRTPDPVSLTLTPITPSVSSGEAESVSPSPVVLTLTPLTPTVTVEEVVGVAPDPLSLTLTPVTPTASGTLAETVTPDPVSLTLTPIAPSVTSAEVVTTTPDPLSLTLTPVTPSTTVAEVVERTPDPLSLTLTPVTPTTEVLYAYGLTREYIVFFDYLLGRLTVSPANDIELVETDPTTNLYAGRQIINTTDNKLKVYYANSWQEIKQLTT